MAKLVLMPSRQLATRRVGIDRESAFYRNQTTLENVSDALHLALPLLLATPKTTNTKYTRFLGFYRHFEKVQSKKRMSKTTPNEKNKSAT